MKLRAIAICLLSICLIATVAYGQDGKTSASYSNDYYDVSVSFGAYYVGGHNVMFGNEVGSFLDTVSEGRKIDNKGWTWRVDAAAGLNIRQPFADRIWLEGGYWQLDNDTTFTRPATVGGTYYFAPLLTIRDASLGALFNEVTDGNFGSDSWAVDWNLLARKDFWGNKSLRAGLVYGLAFRYYSANYNFNMAGFEIDSPLVLGNNTDLSAFGFGPAVGLAATAEYDCGLQVDARVLGKFYYTWNSMDAAQITYGGQVLSPRIGGAALVERLSIDKQYMAPSVDTKLRISQKLPYGLVGFFEGTVDYQAGIPEPRYATQSPTIFLGIAQPSGLDEGHMVNYGLQIGLSKSF
ncbi:MAG: hypothetical protein ABFD97_25885 [Syntrophobacter sp.]